MSKYTLPPQYIFSPLAGSSPILPNIKSVEDKTPYIQTSTNGNFNFYYSLSGQWIKLNVNSDDELRVKKLGVGLNQTDPLLWDITLKSGGQFGDNYSAGLYGFDGTGFLLDYNNTVSTESYMALDNLLVRGNLTVYDFLVIQKRFTNGSLFISNGGKVSDVNGTTITFEDPTSVGACPFVANDLIFAIRYNQTGGSVTKSAKATVNSVSGNSVVVTYDSGTFTIGDEVVRIGNTTDATRQGMIYLTADEATAPYIDILTGINSWAVWGDTSKTQIRLGRLKDFPTTAFGGTVLPDVMGLYMRGNIYLEDGYLALSTQGYIKSGLTSYSDTSHTGFFLGWDSSTNKFKIRNSATKFFDYNGTDFTFQGGYVQTSDRLDTTKNCILIDGGNNVLEFRTAGRSNATDFIIKMMSNVEMGTFDYAGIRVNDGVVYTKNTSNNGYAILNPLAGSEILYYHGLNDTGYALQMDIIGTTDTQVGLGARAFGSTGSFGQYAVVGQASMNSNTAGEIMGGNFTAYNSLTSGTAYGIYARAYGATTNWAGYFDNGNVYVANELQVGANKFTVNSTGQITKINNTVASGCVPISNGTHYEPRVLTVSDVTNAVSTAGSYSNPSWITSLDKSKINGLTASTICASTAGGVLTSMSLAPTDLWKASDAYGEFKEVDSSSTITMDGSTYVKYAYTATGLCGGGITYSSANDNLTVDASVVGNYRISYNVTFSANTANAYYWGLNLNGNIISKTRQIVNVVTTGIGYSVSASGIVNLADGDTIDLGCFGTNGNIVTVIYANVNIVKISN